MKVTVENNTNLPNWPLMMISKEHNAIVLFSGYQNGVVLAPGNSGLFTGYHTNTWNMKQFTRFTGSVSLSAVNGK